MLLIEQITKLNQRLTALNLPGSWFSQPLIMAKNVNESALVTIETGARETPDDQYETHGLQVVLATSFEEKPITRGRTPAATEKYTIALILYSNSLISIESIKIELSKLAEVKLKGIEYNPDEVNSKYLKLQKQVNRGERFLAAITYELTGPVRPNC